MQWEVIKRFPLPSLNDVIVMKFFKLIQVIVVLLFFLGCESEHESPSVVDEAKWRIDNEFQKSSILWNVDSEGVILAAPDFFSTQISNGEGIIMVKGFAFLFSVFLHQEIIDVENIKYSGANDFCVLHWLVEGEREVLILFTKDKEKEVVIPVAKYIRV